MLRPILAGLALLFLSALPANAGLIGSTLEGEYYFPTSSSLYGGYSYSVNPFVVGVGSESVLTVDGFVGIDVDFSDDALVLTYLTPGPWSGSSFNGPKFEILAGAPFDPISSVLTSGGQTVTAAIVSGVLEINWQGQGFTAGQTVTINFESAAVPEPGTLSLVGFGAFGMVAAAIRRRRTKAPA